MMLMFVLKLWGYKKCFYHMYPALLWTHLADFQGILLHTPKLGYAKIHNVVF